MSKPYVSSILSNYGDIDRVKEDVKTLNEILSRQGSNLLLDVVVENVGKCTIMFKLDTEGRSIVCKGLVEDFMNALQERL